MSRRWLIAFLVSVCSLMLVRPVLAAEEVEVLFVVDTSDTMAEELDVLCRELDDWTAGRVGVSYRVLGVSQRQGCARETVVDLIAEGRTSEPEDWGLAVADLAENYAWSSDAARLIVPLSDEGPYQGNPVEDPGDDRQAIETAIRLARENHVVVSPILGNDVEPQVEELAQHLADRTEGQLFKVDDPEEDLMDGVERLVDDLVDRVRARASLVDRLPTPGEVGWRGGALGANLTLAVLLTLLLGVPTFILTDSLASNWEIFSQTRSGRLLAAAMNLSDAASRLLTPGEWGGASSRWRRFLSGGELALFFLLTGLMGAFLQPGFRLMTGSGLGLFAGLTLATVLVGLIHEGARKLVARRLELALDVTLRPASLVITLVCVIFSRLFGVRPGFFYGRPLALRVAALQPEATKRYRLALAGLGATLGAGLAFWGLAWLASWLVEVIEKLELGGVQKTLTLGLGWFEGLFLLVFFVALQLVFFELLPFEVTGGGLLYHRRPWLWFPGFAGVSFLVLHVLVNPEGEVLNLGQSHGLALWLALLFVYSAFVVGVWLYFALLTGGEAGASYNRSQVSTVLAFSLAIIWLLFCLVMLVGAAVRALG